MKFAHFEFDPESDRLGEGPQSEVFRAVDGRLGRTVALKILRPHIEFDPEAVTRFEREAKHTSRLEHPNIATLYEYGQDRGTSYIAMEYLVGRTLDQILKMRILGFDEGLRVAEQVAGALEAVHGAGLIHRDLKPANIMVTEEGVAKLLDFGICRSTGESNITQDGMLVGTVLYMSPEQVRGDELDYPSDVFAFGSVFYHAITGQLPFPGRTFPEVCMAILDGQVTAPAEHRSGFPQPLTDVLLRCLARDPADRYPNGAALHSAVIRAGQALKGGGGRRGSRLKGRIGIELFGTSGGRQAELFAAGLRRDLGSELSRTTGLEVVKVDERALTPGPSNYQLRGILALSGSRGRAEVELCDLDPDLPAGEPVTLEVESSDPDEWGLQGKLVRGLARAIRHHLSEQSQRPAERVERNPELAATFAHTAHDKLHLGTSKHLLAAISGFRRAIDADPACAIAHAGMAEALVRKYLYFDGDTSFLEEARSTARKALALDANCAEAHTSLGFAHSMSGRTEDALREYRLAIQLDQEEWVAHRLLGATQARLGNYKAASPLLRRAIALQPHSIGSYDHLYNVLLRLDRYEEGLEVADRGIASARDFLAEVPDAQEARLHLALLLARMGSIHEARAEVDRAREAASKDGYTLFNIACVLALLDSLEESLECLREARERGYYVQSELWSNTDLDPLRDMPGFKELTEH